MQTQLLDDLSQYFILGIIVFRCVIRRVGAGICFFLFQFLTPILGKQQHTKLKCFFFCIDQNVFQMYTRIVCLSSVQHNHLKTQC